MKVAESLLAALVLGLGGFIGSQTVAVRRATSQGEAAGAIDAQRTPASGAQRTPASGAQRAPASGAMGRDASLNAPVHDDAPSASRISGDSHARLSGEPSYPRLLSDAGTLREMRRRISDGADGTYIAALLLARDSALSRWPSRESRPLRVWVGEREDLVGWSSDYGPAVREAFDVWGGTGIPVRFDVVRDSVGADVHVRFVDRLPNGISGKTVWSRDAGWWLVAGDIQLAVAHPSGGTVSAPQMRAIALHEVGHLLGLDHAEGLDHIMSARVRVRDLSEADRATVRLLYSMPAGSLK